MTEKVKRVVVDMSVSLIHHGHVRLLERAKTLGHVIVALTLDEEIKKHKGYEPELSFEERKEMLLALRYVDEVVPCTWYLDDAFLEAIRADLLIHAGQDSNAVSQVVYFDRTEGISSTELRQRALRAIVEQRNTERCLITPGPSNLHPESLYDLRPVFTRGDDEYLAVERRVLERIGALCGRDTVVPLPGSATTAIEVATTNFLSGGVVVVLSGYYSRRILDMLERKKDTLGLKMLQGVPYEKFLAEGASLTGVDWVVAVYTETADAFLSDLTRLRATDDKLKARLAIDATGSINLEDSHELSDVTMFSSCKGLGGLTGAGFISFNQDLLNRVNPGSKEFVLDIATYLEKKTTGPVHAILSLDTISERFGQMRARVQAGKKRFVELFDAHLSRPGNQPNLCTKVIGANLRMPSFVVDYKPREGEPGSQVVCHLFEQFPSSRPVGSLYDLFGSD